MICPNGHGFDIGDDDRCPMCGTRLKRRSSKAKLHEVTRGDLWVIRDGLKAARTVVKCATKVWPQASEAADLIAKANGRLNEVLTITKWGKRKKR